MNTNADRTMTAEAAAKTITEAILAVAPDVDPSDADPTEDLWYALDLDSMDQLNVLVAIGERTGIEVPEVDYPKLTTMADIVAYLTGGAG